MNTNEYVLKTLILWHSKDEKRNTDYAWKSKPDFFFLKKEKKKQIEGHFAFQHANSHIDWYAVQIQRGPLRRPPRYHLQFLLRMSFRVLKTTENMKDFSAVEYCLIKLPRLLKLRTPVFMGVCFSFLSVKVDGENQKVN